VSGNVTRNQISIHVEALGKQVDFTTDIVLPTTGTAPYPALIAMGAKGGMGGLTMGESTITKQRIADAQPLEAPRARDGQDRRHPERRPRLAQGDGLTRLDGPHPAG
jgi:hypothetical protein